MFSHALFLRNLIYRGTFGKSEDQPWARRGVCEARREVCGEGHGEARDAERQGARRAAWRVTGPAREESKVWGSRILRNFVQEQEPQPTIGQ